MQFRHRMGFWSVRDADHKTTRAEYELSLAAELLIKIHHPKARELFTAMLEDEIMKNRAVDWIVDLDKEAHTISPRSQSPANSWPRM